MLNNDCIEHDWQPAEDLSLGRYRCVSCEAMGWRDTKTGQISPYKSRPPEYASATSSFGDYPSFYPVGDHGRCPSMDDQERRFLGGDENELFFDTDE